MTDRTPAGERLAKVIARSGLCSRRDAEEWIKAGRVVVNGTVIRTPAFNVTPKDKISIDGAPLVARSGTRVWLYHKPPGLVVTEKDPEGRPTIFDALAEAGLPRVLTIGRLDLNTEGLLLLTNDGGLKRVLELPSTGWLRRYRVRAFGTVTQAQLDALKDGIEVDGIKYGPIEAELERQQGSNVWLLVALREGKNREVKNVLASLGLAVNRLIRVSYGPFQLGDLPVGAVEVVRARVLRDQLGKKLAEQAGVDFESEMPEPAATKRPVRGERRAPPERGRPLRRDGRSAGESRPAGPTRRILFDDGRPPEEFTPPSPRGAKRERHEDRPRARPARQQREARFERPARPERPGRAHAGRAASSLPTDPTRPARRPRREQGAGAPAETRAGRPDTGPRSRTRPGGTGRGPRPGGPGRGPRPGGSRPGGAGPGNPRPRGGKPPRRPR